MLTREQVDYEIGNATYEEIAKRLKADIAACHQRLESAPLELVAKLQGKIEGIRLALELPSILKQEIAKQTPKKQ